MMSGGKRYWTFGKDTVVVMVKAICGVQLSGRRRYKDFLLE